MNSWNFLNGNKAGGAFTLAFQLVGERGLEEEDVKFVSSRLSKWVEFINKIHPGCCIDDWNICFNSWNLNFLMKLLKGL